MNDGARVLALLSAAAFDPILGMSYARYPLASCNFSSREMLHAIGRVDGCSARTFRKRSISATGSTLLTVRETRPWYMVHGPWYGMWCMVYGTSPTKHVHAHS